MEKAANQILDLLAAHQFEAYLVGGYVRDRLLQKTIQDIDIATNALPLEVMALFSHAIPTGLQHGTVTVLMDGFPFEITTYRKESVYEEHRRPQKVEFVSDLYEDLQRRDFTINAMAMDAKGTIIDPFKGQDDLKRGIVRCVGDPRERFEEDALRMLRCIRFAVNYGFHIEKDTWDALIEHAPLFKHIAMERVRVELEKMIAGPDPYHALELLLDSKLLPHVKSELQLPLVNWESIDLPSALARLKELEDPLLRWVLLFKSMQITSDRASKALRRLTFSTRFNRAVVQVLKLNEWLHEQVKLAVLEKDKPVKVEAVSLAEARVTLERPVLIWKRAAVQFGKETMLHWLKVMPLVQSAIDDDTHEVKSIVFASFLEKGEEWLAEMRVETLADLDIDGSDLIGQFELPAGPWVSEILHRLLLDTAFGNARNQKNLLLERAKIYRKELNKQ